MRVSLVYTSCLWETQKEIRKRENDREKSHCRTSVSDMEHKSPHNKLYILMACVLILYFSIQVFHHEIVQNANVPHLVIIFIYYYCYISNNH